MINKNINNFERDFIRGRIGNERVREVKCNENRGDNVLNLSVTNKLAKKPGEAGFGAKRKDSLKKNISSLTQDKDGESERILADENSESSPISVTYSGKILGGRADTRASEQIIKSGIIGNAVNEKKKKGSNRVVEHDRLILNYNKYNKQEYLNISVGSEEQAGMAEWSLRSIDTRCPSGFEGSIPSAGVLNSSKNVGDF